MQKPSYMKLISLRTRTDDPKAPKSQSWFWFQLWSIYLNSSTVWGFFLSSFSNLGRKLYYVNVDFSITKCWQKPIGFVRAFMKFDFVLYVKRILNSKMDFFLYHLGVKN